ncbi:MerR family transcriptional regulator [Jiangella rhizosphaerae]|uniref:MerR family transcriptional regulator n=1 Tax=Jiangella rhizosphaerae TaxID=2293569 RepID=A0A418KHZ7_9ACTN|nr:MerR family transcriptional regulator [Jiangella rhizosphaerae]
MDLRAGVRAHRRLVPRRGAPAVRPGAAHRRRCRPHRHAAVPRLDHLPDGGVRRGDGRRPDPRLTCCSVGRLDSPVAGDTTVVPVNDDGPFLSIGDLARRTGLPVKTIRYYADIGLVPPTDRSPAGYRRYDAVALARLDLVRTLRELGIDLATVRRVLDRSLSLADMATAHAAALDAQIRLLRTRRSVLRAVAALGIDDHEELDLMNRLAHLSAAERQQIIDDYWESAFEGLDTDPAFAERMRSVRVDLPDDPTPAQVEAWVELAELVQDPSYRARVRQMAEAGASSGSASAGPAPAEMALYESVTELVTPLRSADVAPGSPEGRLVVDQLAPRFAHARGVADGADFRRELGEQIALFSDRRVERYWELVGIINGWPREQVRSGSVATMEWFAQALIAAAEA